MGSKVRKLTDSSGTVKSFMFNCPGCKESHVIHYEGHPNGLNWKWDGNEEAPTISPSFLVHPGKNIPRCLTYVKKGKIQFLSDCTHELAGQTVDMLDFKYDREGWAD